MIQTYFVESYVTANAIDFGLTMIQTYFVESYITANAIDVLPLDFWILKKKRFAKNCIINVSCIFIELLMKSSRHTIYKHLLIQFWEAFFNQTLYKDLASRRKSKELLINFFPQKILVIFF